MKTLSSLVIFCILLSINGHAAIITAVQNGNWTAASTWDVARVPQDNDQVVIPAARTVSFTGSPYPKNTPTTRPTLNIKIYGTLDFSAVGNDKLYLDAGSTIQIFFGGKIQTNTASSEIIAIYNGTDDNTVWSGTPATLNGPISATATSSGFSNGVLPIKLESFTIKKDNKGLATLTWITSTEINSSSFEIERLKNKSASWQFIGQVNAAGNTSATREYHYVVLLVSGENQFRLKQIDIDGKFTYSAVVNVTYNANDKNVVTYDKNTHQLFIKSADTESVNISIFDALGHNIYRGLATSQMKFEPMSPGIYVVNIVNQHSRFAKKIMVY